MYQITAALVRNQKLHLATKGGKYGFNYSRCAGRRVSSPLVSVTVEGDFDHWEGDAPMEERMAFALKARNLAKEAVSQLAAELTEAQRANLCEKCCGSL